MAKSSHEDVLIAAVFAKQPQVTLENCVMPLNTIIKNAFKKDRRLLAYFGGFEAVGSKKGMLQLGVDYDLTIKYLDQTPNKPDDVVIDEGNWDAKSVFSKVGPVEMTIITDDTNRLQDQINGAMELLMSRYEGFFGWQWDGITAGDMTDDSMVHLSYQYLLPVPDLRQMQGKAAFAAKTIWKSILGRANVPQFVKPFLALSYLAQECSYDQRAYDEVVSNPENVPSDPVPSLAYGPLVEHRGICTGFAWAFKRLMDEANIECICVSGYLTDGGNVGHMWNLVKLDGQYYHVDPTWGSKGSSVDVSKLMQPDSVMKASHIWGTSQYPAARGMRLDYDYVEDYLADNGDAFIDDGANEKYLFPDSIMD